MEKSSFLTFWRWWMFCPVIPVCLFVVVVACTFVCVWKTLNLKEELFFFILKKMRAKKCILFEVSISKRRRAFLFSFSGDFVFWLEWHKLCGDGREREIQSIWDFPWWVWGTTSWPNETETTIKVESSYSPKLGVFLFSLSDGRRCRIRFVVFLSAALLDNIHVKRKKKLERKKRRETNDGENLTDRSERQREKERIMNRKKESKKV